MTMTSEVSASDPCPEIPEQFVDPTRILKLARELKKQALPAEDGLKETTEPEVGSETLAENPAWFKRPVFWVTVRTLGAPVAGTDL
jgi:hypothetical protein